MLRTDCQRDVLYERRLPRRYTHVMPALSRKTRQVCAGACTQALQRCTPRRQSVKKTIPEDAHTCQCHSPFCSRDFRIEQTARLCGYGCKSPEKQPQHHRDHKIITTKDGGSKIFWPLSTACKVLHQSLSLQYFDVMRKNVLRLGRGYQLSQPQPTWFKITHAVGMRVRV